jgi:hypothetical protein
MEQLDVTGVTTTATIGDHNNTISKTNKGLVAKSPISCTRCNNKMSVMTCCAVI